MLPPRAALVSVVLDATRDHVDIHDPCSRWRNHVEVRDLLLAVMDQEASAAKVSMLPDSSLKMRDTEGFCNIPPTHTLPSPQRYSLDRKLLKRVL
jgi:hypothetical protein